MVHNPGRNKKQNRRSGNAKLQAPKNYGVKQSAINARNGIGEFAPPTQAPVKTPHGTRSALFEGKSFSTYFETMQPRNKTLSGYSKGEKSINVLRGVMWLTTAPLSKGNKVKTPFSVVQLHAGKHVMIPAKTVFYLSTANDIVEFQTTESVNFITSWVTYTDDAIKTAATVVDLPPMDANGEYVLKDIPPRRAKNESAAYKQAQKLRDKKKVKQTVAKVESNRQQSYSNANSANVIGVNLRPVIPTADD